MSSINGCVKPGVNICTDTKKLSFYCLQKRLLDLAIAVPLLLVLSPLFTVVAVLIRLDSAGPAFHRRKVVGRGRRAFSAFKFRSMVEDADCECISESDRQELQENHKLRCDRRITRVGKFIRKTSIDELPQLINVVLGQMSLVGPRMISFPEIEKFGVYWGKILSVKPGITGLWQVSGRNNLAYDDRVRLNIYYIDHRSIWLDLTILMKTIPAVISGRGAY